MNPRKPVAGILLACGLALLAAGCATAPTQAAYADAFRSYGIIAADDRGVLAPPEFDKVQIGIVQYLVSAGLVHDGQIFVADPRRADVVFRVTIAWQEARNSFTIVSIAQAYPGTVVAGGTPVASGVPYEPWYDDDYYDYPDFGSGYESYLPLIGIVPWMPFLDHPGRGGRGHPGDRDHGRDRDHRPPGAGDKHRPGDTWDRGDQARTPPSGAGRPGAPGVRPPDRHPRTVDQRPPPDRRGPPPDRHPRTVDQRPPPGPPPRASVDRRPDPPRPQRVESGARSTPPPPSRSESHAAARSFDSGGRSSSPPPTRSDSGSSRSGGDSGSSRSGGDSGSSRSGGDSGSSRSGGDSDRHGHDR